MTEVDDCDSQVITLSNSNDNDYLIGTIYTIPECCIFIYSSEVHNVYIKCLYKIYDRDKLTDTYERLRSRFDISVSNKLYSLKEIYDINKDTNSNVNKLLNDTLGLFVKDPNTDSVYQMFAYLIYNCRCFNIEDINYKDMREVLKKSDSEIREMCKMMIRLIRSSISILN